MAKKLLEQMRDALRLKHYSYRAEEAYLDWVKRYILFHHKRHPAEMGAAEVQAFPVHLATQRQVSASTQNQALSVSCSSTVKSFIRKSDLSYPPAPNAPNACPLSLPMKRCST